MLLRSYTAISLALPALDQGRQPKSTFECFFDFKQDTLYIAASENVTVPYADCSMDRLNTSLLYRVQSLALQGEEFWCEEFYAGPPYNNMTPTTAVFAEKLRTMLARTPAIKSLSVVVGDDYSQARHVYSCPYDSRPYGLIKLTELTCGRPPTRDYVGAEKQLQAWMEFLLNHFPHSIRADMAIKQAVRGQSLVIIDVWRLLDLHP